ncbi:type II toxin-antitoxin system RelE/ParE family toxin [Coralliovum pocilloporae]|uniref:type II toxin-antitoxin system RelE/ParE family toxin n=1 Tax=Coralliovum pocilloporae TaxID=3066369 RepID=UPI003306CE33
MRRRIVEISEAARQDIAGIYDWIATAGSPQDGLGYVERIVAFCEGFDLASERGSLREDIRPGLRIVGFERNATIAFMVEDERVIILRVFYGGQNWEDAMA